MNRPIPKDENPTNTELNFQLFLKIKTMKNYIILFSFLFSIGLVAQEPNNSRVEHFNLGKEKLALQGYDPVAYFRVGALKGEEGIRHTHQGVTYWFSNTDYKADFIENPETYEPQYGGWSAYEMATDGKLKKVDPESFEIRDGKLYLFNKCWFNNTRKKWQNQRDELRPKADENWGEIVSGESK